MASVICDPNGLKRIQFTDGDGERRTAARFRVVVGEVVDQFLDADGVRRRQLVVVEKPPHVGVRRGVDID